MLRGSCTFFSFMKSFGRHNVTRYPCLARINSRNKINKNEWNKWGFKLKSYKFNSGKNSAAIDT